MVAAEFFGLCVDLWRTRKASSSGPACSSSIGVLQQQIFGDFDFECAGGQLVAADGGGHPLDDIIAFKFARR